MINVAWHRAGESQVVKYATTPCSTWYCDSSDMTTKCVVESGFIYPMLFLFVRLSVFFFSFHVDHVDHFFYKSFSFCFVLFGVKSEIYINKK